jgi:hypothetical protein
MVRAYRWTAIARPVLLSLATVVLLAGCATIVKGTTQLVSIDTPGAPGAKCKLVSPAVGTMEVTTPANVTLAKGSEAIAVSCRKQCFTDGTSTIASNTEAMAAGNIIAGGIIGLGVDAATGAMHKYNEHNSIMMMPISGCRAGA